ncbi:MAG: alpha/beta hydrolase family protein, partial [Asticcacaulis sp.]
MKKVLMACAAAMAITATPVLAEDAAGDWAGVLMGKLHLIVHITKGADGSLSGVLESVDQGDVKLPLDAVEATPDHLKLTLKAIGGGYDGAWDDTKKQWSGAWSQGGG